MCFLIIRQKFFVPIPSLICYFLQAVITHDSEDTLKEIGINFESGSRNLFIVEGLDGQNPRLVLKHDDLELGASASPEEPSSSNSSSPPLLTQIPESGYSSYRFVTPKKDSCRFQRRKQRLSLSESIDSPSGVGESGNLVVAYLIFHPILQTFSYSVSSFGLSRIPRSSKSSDDMLPE